MLRLHGLLAGYLLVPSGCAQPRAIKAGREGWLALGHFGTGGFPTPDKIGCSIFNRLLILRSYC